MKPGDDVFTEADLEPGDDERRIRRRLRLDRALVVASCAAAGIWAGGLLGLGTAAMSVFPIVPDPESGIAMGTAFARFDRIAVGCVVVLLGCEVGRTILGRHSKQTIVVRLRRYLAIGMGLAAVYSAVRLTPKINAMYGEGIRRHMGARGAELQQTHKRAEGVAKAILPLAIVLMGLHVFTLRTRDDEEDDLWGSAPVPEPALRPAPTPIRLVELTKPVKKDVAADSEDDSDSGRDSG